MKNTKFVYRHRQRGLTLVAIVVVIALLGLLMTIVGGALFNTLKRSKGDVTRLKIQEIEREIENLQKYVKTNINRPFQTTQR